MYVSSICGYRYWTYINYGGFPCRVSGYTGGATRTYGTNWRSGSSVKNWSKLIAKKQDATTNYERREHHVKTMDPVTLRRSLENVSCTATKDKVVPISWTAYTIPINALQAPPGSFPVDSVLEDIALAKLRARMNEYQSNYNAFVPIGELREFSGLVRGISRSASSMLTGLIETTSRVHSRKGLSRLMSGAASGWLSWSFGLKPMISDMEDVCEAIFGSTGPRPNQRVSSTTSKSWMSNSSELGVSFSPVQNVDIRRTFHHQLSFRYFAAMSPFVKSSNNWLAARDALGLNAWNIVPAAYELVPYSWLIDYFSTAGDCLEDAFEVNRPLVYSGICRRYVMNERSCAQRAVNPLDTLIHPGSFEAEVRFFKRSSFGGSLPNRQLRFKTIDEIARNGAQKVSYLTSILLGKHASVAKRYGPTR